MKKKKKALGWMLLCIAATILDTRGRFNFVSPFILCCFHSNFNILFLASSLISDVVSALGASAHPRFS
jgi:hypothetical protein